MNRYITIFLFFIVILLVGFFIFIQPHLQSSRQGKIRENLLSLDPDKVRAIHIRNGDDVIRINRQGTDWHVINSEVQDHASPEEVSKIFQSANDLHIFDKISADEFNKNLKIRDFGLKDPKHQFTLIGDGGQRVFFGNDAAIGGRVYARKQNSQTVYVVPNQLQFLISQPFNAFRDRQLTQLTSNQISDFVVKRMGGKLEVQQTGNNIWEIIRPLETRADTQKVNTFLDALLSAPILEFVDDDSGDLSRFGIDERSTSLIFKADTHELPMVLKVGAPSKTGEYYVQFTGRKSIVRLPVSVVKLLEEINSEELRERSLLQINSDVLDRIIIRAENRILVLTRKDTGWNARQDQLEFSVSDEKVQRFLSALQKQGIKKFLSVSENVLPSYGLYPPQASVDFYSLLSENTPESPAGSHKIASLLFSAPFKENVVYARSLASPEVLVVDPSVLNLISSDPAHWK